MHGHMNVKLKWYLKEAGWEPVDWIHLTGSCEIYVT